MESSKQSFDWDEVRDSVLIAEQSVELERLMASSDEGVYEKISLIIGQVRTQELSQITPEQGLYETMRSVGKLNSLELLKRTASRRLAIRRIKVQRGSLLNDH